MSFLESAIGNLIDKAFGRVSQRQRLTTAEEEKVISEWQRVTDQVSTGSPSGLKQAVIQADRLMEYALRCLIGGQTLGENLKVAKARFSDSTYNRLWEAHKVRNALVHDPSYDPPHFVAKEAIDKFLEAFRELGIRV